MWEFLTSESGTVTRRSGLSLAWVVVALLAATVISVVPAMAGDCVPVGNCYGIACNTCHWMGCQGYPPCGPPGYFQQWLRCNLDVGGCFIQGTRCVQQCTYE